MQEQNFEKQVAEKMEELNLAPSAPVWQKVEREIRKKKDRRRLVLWLFLILLVGGGTATWLVMDRPSSGSTASAPIMENNESLPGDQNLNNNQTIETAGDKDSESLTSIDKDISNEVNGNEVVSNKKEREEVLVDRILVDKAVNNKQVRRNNQKDDSYAATTKPVNEKDLDPVNTVQPDTKTEPVIDTKEPLQEVVDPKPTEPKSTDVQQPSNDSIKTEQKTITDTVNKKPGVKKEAEVIVQKDEKKKSKWVVGFNAAAGVSHVYSELFTSTAALSDLSNVQYPIPGTGSSFGPPPPAELNAGVYYSAGLSLKKELGKQWTFVTGLQYSMFSTKQQVGAEQRRDTVLNRNNESLSLDNFYSNSTYSAQKSDYTNKYHFIELPVGIEFKPFNRLPLGIGAGITLSQLLSSNALVYNRPAGIYYQDNSLINKTQFHVQANIQYTFLKQRKFSLSAGPFIQSAITTIVEDSKDRLFAAGLKTNISF